MKTDRSPGLGETAAMAGRNRWRGRGVRGGLCFSLLLSATCLLLPTHPVAALEEGPLEGVLRPDRRWVGDFDEMVERRVIRVLVTYSKTDYFFDGAHPRGATYELLKEFEKAVNRNRDKRHLKVHVITIPVSRDRLMPALLEGRGDIAAASLTVTPERQKLADFSTPLISGVSEVVVTGPGVPAIDSLEDLSGKQVHVRASSSYYESLQRFNESLTKAGKAPMVVNAADEYLESEDLLEMVNAGLIPITIVDSYLAEFWSRIFENLTVHRDIAVKTGRQIAWMFRKDSPKLREIVNGFVKKHKKGTLFGNILFKRYLRNTKWVRNLLADEEMARFKETVAFFKKYASMYDFDWLILTAMAYHESRLDQEKRSEAGAVGVMQLLPSTAANPPISLPGIEDLEKNVHAGAKYLRFIIDEYFKEEDMDRLNKALFAFASYNAGPSRISRLRRQAEKEGFDPNRWFGNVEVLAAKKIGRETVRYVSSIYKYYVAYRFILEQKEKKQEAIGAMSAE